MTTKNLKKHHQNSNLVFGIFLVVVGAIVLALNFGAKGSDLRPILFSWQMLLFIFGLLFMINRKYLFGGFLIIVAGFFAIPPLAKVFPEMHAWVQPDFLKTYWAFLLVVAGAFVIIHRLCCRNSPWDGSFSSWSKTSSENTDGFMKRETLFSGIEEIFQEPIFRGADLKCTFGGAEIDLRKAALPEGDTFVRIKCAFGGVVLVVPESWYVEIRTNSIFGGVTDSRIKNCEIDKTRRLVITGECAFGGCEIK